MEQRMEEITLEINRQKSGAQVLKPSGATEDGGRTEYRFAGKGAEAAVTVERRGRLAVGTVRLRLSDEAFRESDRLALQKPVKIGIRFAEAPKRMTAMYLFGDWWTRPKFLRRFEEMPERTQSLCMEYGDRAEYLLPMAGERYKTMAEAGEPGVLTLTMTAYLGGIGGLDEPAFLLAEGRDIYEAVHLAFRRAAEEKRIPMRRERAYPEPFEYLGWCSWNACYTELSEEKIRAKAKEFAEKKIPVRWILLDDGWLSVRDGRLYDLAPEKEKFPRGFRDMTAQIRENSPVRWFGVWHALGGYWGGIEPGSRAAREEAGRLYRTRAGRLLPYPEAGRGYGFFRDWYEKLRADGISFVKVDGQSAVKNYYENDLPVCRAARESHAALEGAAAAYFRGNLINCMGMAMENVLSRPGSALTRNSDDFVPEKEDGFAEHLLQNAYNAVYQDELYYCDWDMFWTSHRDARRHGILRAVGGGPVYISDRIGETKKDVLSPLILDDGRVLRMDRAAKPSPDCVFTDPREGGLIKLTNTGGCGNGEKGAAVAVYNLCGRTAETVLRAGDVYDLPGGRFYLYNSLTGRGRPFGRDSEETVRLDREGCALYLLVPEKQGFVAVGLLEKYIAFRGVEQIFYERDAVEVVLRQAGVFGFYSESRVASLRINGEEALGRAGIKDGFCRVRAEGPGKIRITIRRGEK